MEQLNLFEVLYEKYKIKKPIRLIELFGGIGSQAKALENLHANFEHYKLVEYDKYPVASYNEVHGTHFKPTDITKIHASDLEIVDKDKFEYLLTYSFPCQDISGAGKMRGFNKDNQLNGKSTRSGLLWEVERLLNECGTELPQVLMLENVKNLLCDKFKPDFDAWLTFLESKGYSNYYEVLNSKDYGIPQNRERVFCVSILHDRDTEYYYEFPKPIPLELKLKDLLEDEVDEKYYLSRKMITYLTGENQKQSKFPRGERFKESLRLTNEKGIATTINTSAGNRPVDNFIIEFEDDKPSFDEVYDKLLMTDCNQGVVVRIGNYSPSGHSAASIVDSEGIAPTVMENHGTVTATNQGLRIRKLTPKECWRLMGFTDEDFDKAAKVNSNAQLYKQAGNSIVVNVLMAIFSQLL